MQESEQIKQWTTLFWAITQRVVALPYRRFGITSVPSSRVKKNSRPWRMRPIGCTETSVRKCHYSLPNNPEQRSSHILRGGSINHFSSNEVWRDKDQFISFRTSSYHANILTVPCSVAAASCSFQSCPQTASVSPNPNSQLQNRHGLLLKFSFRLLGIIYGALLPNFNLIFECLPQITGISTSRIYPQRDPYLCALWSYR
jgi:hypothetical protein